MVRGRYPQALLRAVVTTGATVLIPGHLSQAERQEHRVGGILERADVAAHADGSPEAALVGGDRGTGATRTRRRLAGVDGGAAGQQGLSLRRAPVVLQRPEQRVPADVAEG